MSNFKTLVLPQRPFVGVHLVLLQDDKILLMKRTVKDSMGGMYALVTGKVNQYESPRIALVREAKEEVGIDIDPTDLDYLLTVHHAKSDFKGEQHDVIEFYFVAKSWRGTPANLEPHKASDLAFYPLDNLPQPLPKGLSYAIKALKGGLNFVEN